MNSLEALLTHHNAALRELVKQLLEDSDFNFISYGFNSVGFEQLLIEANFNKNYRICFLIGPYDIIYLVKILLVTSFMQQIRTAESVYMFENGQSKVVGITVQNYSFNETWKKNFFLYLKSRGIN